MSRQEIGKKILFILTAFTIGRGVENHPISNLLIFSDTATRGMAQVKHITLIQGHPDPQGGHFCHVLADAYLRGAAQSGHAIQVIDVAQLEFPLLRSRAEFHGGPVPDDIAQAQSALAGAEHLVFIYPIWMGTMPALLKGFLEQAFRPGFAVNELGKGVLKGKSARIVVTMAMPALIYRWYYRAHGLRSFEHNILGFAGIGPMRENLIGMVEGMNDAARQKWVHKMEKQGRAGC